MKLREFLRSESNVTAVAFRKGEYTPYDEGKDAAIKNLISAQRKAYTCLSYGIIMTNYVLVTLRIKAAPKL